MQIIQKGSNAGYLYRSSLTVFFLKITDKNIKEACPYRLGQTQRILLIHSKHCVLCIILRDRCAT